LKKAAVAEFDINGKITHVAAVHLTSDKSKNAVTKRRDQLLRLDSFMTSRNFPSILFFHLHSLSLSPQITKWLGGKDNFVIGDFNFGDDGENVLPYEYDDVWKVLRPRINKKERKSNKWFFFFFEIK
jgi:hypothetical protein